MYALVEVVNKMCLLRKVCVLLLGVNVCHPVFLIMKYLFTTIPLHFLHLLLVELALEVDEVLRSLFSVLEQLRVGILILSVYSFAQRRYILTFYMLVAFNGKLGGLLVLAEDRIGGVVH